MSNFKQYPDEILKILHKVGLNNNLRDIEVKEIYESQFKFIFETIRKLELFEGDDEDLENLKTNFQIKYLGKLFINKERIKKLKETWKKESNKI